MSMYNEVAGLRIRLASPEQIRSWSYGEVTKPDTINYLTQKPVKGGLFCERIFGPLKDWCCACGKYRRQRTAGFVCQHCGVEVAPSRVRRERMGHIALVAPVVHSWFARSTPSTLALLLDLTPRRLASILAYAGYLVTQVDEQAREQALGQGSHDHSAAHARSLLATVAPGAYLDEDDYQSLHAHYPSCAQVCTGAGAIRERLALLDLDALAEALRSALDQQPQHPHKILKRLRIVEAFRTSGVDPGWMVLDVIPVLPPDLRPLVHVGGGRFASSDLNSLYERVLHRNARIQRFLANGAPESILRYEKRLLQDACDALFDNARRNRPVMGSHKQPLKSLTDNLKGKQGRFRRNLLGKRVDYSGRSVICVGLDLKLHECGLPKKIALELFKPFVMRKLIERYHAHSPRHAKRLVERRDPCVWDQLAECMHEKVVLLNRAPTLHRLSIQAFEAKLVEGDAIRLHPLVCSAFNADFDGDQMAVHLPVSDEAQAEARRLLLSTRNLRSPAAGEPAISLSQEIVLGCFYLTELQPSAKRSGRAFVDRNEALLAFEQGCIDLHTRILVRIPDGQVAEAPPPAPAIAPLRGRVETTVGRLIFNEVLPPGLRYRNYEMTKERLKQLLAESLTRYGEEVTARLADAIKQLGYRYATKSGISFGMSDMQQPPEKQDLVAKGQARAHEIHSLYAEGTITQEERDRQIIALWTEVTEQISEALIKLLDPFGTLSTIIKSGCTKAKFQQIRQLSGIRGLMADPSGHIIPIPVLGNYLVGLLVWEIFIAASGARKGFMDRSLNTAQSGYLTRKLVEVGMEVWTTMHDCGTQDGWLLTNTESKMLGLPDLRSRAVGRVLAEQVGDLAAGTLLESKQVDALLDSGIEAIRVRSPLTCQAPYGICCRCYGQDLASGCLVKRGVAVGVIAGQSIGEPGTQLTMRTFHSGGIANAQGDITMGLPRVSELFEARTPRKAAALAEREGTIHIHKAPETGKTKITVAGEPARPGERVQHTAYELDLGQTPLVEEGQTVTIGTPLTTGARDLKRLLSLQGEEATARYLINEVQRVYRTTGVYINDKHVEVIVRQMLRYVLIQDAGDTTLLPGNLVDRYHARQMNQEVLAQGGQPSLASPVVLGLTRVALNTASWIAAASFQETSRVLSQAAIQGQVDWLKGYKERVVIGLRIPTNAA